MSHKAAKIGVTTLVLATVFGVLLYTTLGEFIHGEGRRLEITDDPVAVLQLLLKAADLPPELADAVLDESHDRYIRSETVAGQTFDKWQRRIRLH